MTTHRHSPVSSPRGSEQGAILIQVAIGLLVLIGFLGFVADYGLLWVARRQAQNAADAGALAGAVAMAFDNDDRTATGPAKTAAYNFAISNYVAGEAPNVIDPAGGNATDVKFYNEQPAAFPPECADNSCIRVDVHRNQARANPLPVWFSQAFNMSDQGVRATATARVAVANASDCLKPFAIPDKWLDRYDVNPVIDVDTWTMDDAFEKHLQKGQTVTPLANPDYYEPADHDSVGTGFNLADDLGLLVELKAAGPQDSIAPGNYFPVRLPMANGEVSTGGADYEWNIANCNGVPIKIGDTLENEPGNMVGPTAHGMADLIALDPSATWNPTEKRVENSCAQAQNPCATHSPRVVAIPIYDTGVFYNGKMNGLVTLKIVNILGFFVDQMQGNQVRGYFTTIPGLTVGGGTITPEASFMYSIGLVR